MTSNIGSQRLLEGIDSEGNLYPEVRQSIEGDLHQYFRPEFLNRIDDTLIFLPLRQAEILQIVDLLVNQLRLRLSERGLILAVSEAAKQLVVKSSYDPIYGARPIKRFLQREVETLIARRIIANDLPAGSGMLLEVVDGALTIVVTAPPK